MNKIQLIVSVFVALGLFTCTTIEEHIKLESNYITLISINAPCATKHFVSNDTLGKKSFDTIGPYRQILHPGFTYYDAIFQEKTWMPNCTSIDTLRILVEQENLEVTYPNPYFHYPHTFLFQAGDSVLITFENGIPRSQILNREYSNIEVNYDRIKMKELYSDSYSPHLLIIGVLLQNDFDLSMVESHQKAVDKSLKYLELERLYLDSLYSSGKISINTLRYRSAILSAIQWDNSIFQEDEMLNEEFVAKENINNYIEYFPRNRSDSLINYLHHRKSLLSYARYNLPLLKVNYYNKTGASYIDSRIQFDSILADNKLDSLSKRFLIKESFEGIVENFTIADRLVYQKKLEDYIGNKEFYSLSTKLELGSEVSDSLFLRKSDSLEITYREVLENNSDSNLLVYFWATWCSPCIRKMPEYEDFKSRMKGLDFTFVEIALNDNYENWTKVKSKFDALENSYFATNSKTSLLPEKLGVDVLPYYLVYYMEKDRFSPNVYNDFEKLLEEVAGIE